MKKFLLLAGILFFLPLSSFAAEFKAEESLSMASPVNSDLYLAGKSLQVQSEVNGDLAVLGGQINIKGNIKNDLLALGGNITLAGTVQDDVRILGGTTIISGDIGGDLVVLGGKVLVTKEAKIYGDLRIFGGQISMDGYTAGTVYIHSNLATMNGNIKGDTQIAANTILIGDQAKFDGKVSYWADEKVDFKNAVSKGSAQIDKNLDKGLFFSGSVSVLKGIFWQILTAALLLLIFSLIPGKIYHDAAKRVHDNFFTYFGWGVLYFILTPVLILLLFITIVGIPLGLFLALLYGFVIFFAKALASLVFSRLIGETYGLKLQTSGWYFLSIAMYCVFTLAELVPVIGWLAVFLAVSSAIGALLKMKIEFLSTWKA